MGQRRTLRLSQIIEMYYSHGGVSFDPEVKACNRQHLYTELFKTTDLFTETSRFAHVLSLRQITVYIPVEEMQRITNAAVDAFSGYVCKCSMFYHQFLRYVLLMGYYQFYIVDVTIYFVCLI